MNRSATALAALAAFPALAAAQTLTTGLPNNGGSQGWAVYFDLTALSSDLDITGLQTYNSGTAGVDVGFEVYTRPGTHAGFTDSRDGWTLLGTALGVGASNGTNLPSNLIDIPDIQLTQGAVTGVALLFTATGPRYNGLSAPIQQVYENSDLRLFGGVSKSVPFSPTGSTFTPRVFAGVVHYAVAGCYPDCDTSTGVGVLDIFDFLCFQNRYDAGAAYACDCDTSTGPGVCDIFDFLCFQNAYDAGCP